MQSDRVCEAAFSLNRGKPIGEYARESHVSNIKAFYMTNNINTNSNISNISRALMSPSEFVKFLLSDGGSDAPFDFDFKQRLEELLKQIQMRSGVANFQGDAERVNYQFVVQQASERYFALLAWTFSRLAFSEAEYAIIRESICGPYWQWHLPETVAQAVANDEGIDLGNLELLPKGSQMRVILEKLVKLDPLENVALIDHCERSWRTPSSEASPKPV